jgi:hypothetical protein
MKPKFSIGDNVVIKSFYNRRVNVVGVEETAEGFIYKLTALSGNTIGSNNYYRLETEVVPFESYDELLKKAQSKYDSGI